MKEGREKDFACRFYLYLDLGYDHNDDAAAAADGELCCLGFPQ
jgi:hypothetical protein